MREKYRRKWNRALQAGLWLIVVLWFAAICTLVVKSARADEGPVDSLGCLARAAYWEARSQSDDAQREVVYTFLNRARQWGISPCAAVVRGSTAAQSHIADKPAEPKAWAAAQSAAIMAWQNPKLDPLGAQSPAVYFIDIHALKRAGYSTIYAGQYGDLIFFAEKPLVQGGKP